MASKKDPTPLTFTTASGKQLVTREQLLAEVQRLKGAKQAGAPAVPAVAAPPPPEDVQAVLEALLLIGGTRGAGGLCDWLQVTGRVRQGSGRAFVQSHVSDCLRELARQGQADAGKGSGYVVDRQAHAELLQTLLLQAQAPQYWRQAAWVYGGGQGDWRSARYWLSLRGSEERVALLRLFLFSGVDVETFAAQMRGAFIELNQAPLLIEALTQPWMPRLVERLAPDLREQLLGQLLDHLPAADPRVRPLRGWLQQRWATASSDLSPGLRVRMAEARVLALDFEAARALVTQLGSLMPPVIDAAEQTARGDWPAATALFEQGIKAIRQAAGARRGALSIELSRLYLASLLAQPDPKAWSVARKYCIAESGSRKPSPYEWWGLWAHVIGARLGEDSLDPNALAHLPGLELREDALDHAADRLLLAAWIGKPAPGWTAAAAGSLVQRLQRAEQPWQARWVAHAAELLDLGKPAVDLQGRAVPATFLGTKREPWRDALAAISALAEDKKPAAKAAAGPALAWQLTLDPQGRVQAVEPLERSASARGVVKLKPVTLTRLKKNESPSPQDGAVLRHIERTPWGGVNSWQLDVTGAAVALVGHPAVMFADVPGQAVELAEAQPELEVLRRTGPEGDERFEFSIQPPLLSAELPELAGWYGNNFEAERDKRNGLRIVRDGPQTARLIRISATQRRVAELVAQGWTVPADATAELGTALQVLSGHFQLHSDADAGQQVPGDSRLRARLVPLGDGLQLQLVAQPFGAFGPAVTPGQGRARLMCLHEGLSLATERDLAAENQHRLAVLDALPFLDPEQSAESAWLLTDAEQALQVVERLPALPGIAALDWPKGKPLRVTPVASTALNVSVSSGRDWLALTGEARLDETRLLGLQELMQLARASRSRFVRLGEGDYLALSEQLRQQLRDLDALAVSKKDQLQLPHAAASWLDDTLAEMGVEGDKPWRARLDALATAAALQPVPPPGLRAELRGYQLEGFAWMMRLAAAGLGACLADDMGLGKTVQTLAVLIARAEQGPALVLAPTSVCGNWLAETGQFAPGLRCQIYGEGADRAAQIAEAGPGDVLVVSYALAQIDAEAFAEKSWATLVMDEAQALKNAATKRAKSVAEFKAGFSLALSGTPVENRLADLWSIMNLINPGLLGTAPQFSERFATPIEKHQDGAARQRLRRLVSPFLLRRTKSQVLQDLPPRTEIVHLVQPSGEERHFLEALRRNAQEAVNNAEQPAPMQVLAELMRLRRAACDPRLVAPELGLVGAKIGEFERIVRELVDGSHKALVFSQFTDFLKMLAERLDAMGVKYQYLDGSTPAAERTRRVAAFQRGEGEVFLISLKAGGFGLNLTMADYVLIVDPWWNPAAEDQATGRAHRMGQQRPVTVYRLVTAGSVEERIIDLHRDKRGLADGVLEGQEEVTVLDAKALTALLRE